MERLIAAIAASHARALVALFVLCLAFFLSGQFTLQPMDRDEPRFAQASKQMLETGDFVDIRFQDEARHKKPVGIYWLQVASVAAAERLGFENARNVIGFYRIPSLIGAMAAVLLTYWAALAFLSRPGALLAAGLMAASILLGVEARLAKTDAVLTATVIAAMGALARVWFAHVSPMTRKEPGIGNALVFWLAIGIGVLIKGPITPLIPLIVFIAMSLRERSVRWGAPLRPLMGLGIVAIIALPWLVAIAVKSGGSFFADSVGKDMLGKVGGVAEKHWGPPGAYFIAFWATFWPAAPLTALAGLFAWKERKDDAVLFLIAWFLPMWLVLEAMPTKLPHYVLPLYPAIAILIVMAVERHSIPERGWRPWTAAALMLLIPFGLLVGAPVAFWKFDGSVPVTAMPLLLVAAGLALFAASELKRARLVRGAVFGILAALPLTAAGFKFGMPQLEAINLSRRLADIAHAQGCKDPKYATVSYREPSLVFLTATDLRMLKPTGEVRTFAETAGGDCRIVFLDQRDKAAMTSGLPASATPHKIVGTVNGININGGKPVAIDVWLHR
jgi:4-amino-4-deoxy-L-arabinose transferase-like glycosyltransferase